MKRKVRITKTPSYKEGGMHTGDQDNYGLYRGGGHLQDYLTGTEESDEKVRTTDKEVPREMANIEAEKGEYRITNNMDAIFKIGGEKHINGGTPMLAKPGDYIVSAYTEVPQQLQSALAIESDSRKKKDNTPAALLGKYVDNKDFNRLSKFLQDAEMGKEVDPFALKTAQVRMPEYIKRAQKVVLAGELSKAFQGKEYTIPQMAMPYLMTMMEQQDTREDNANEQPLSEARYGGYMYQDGGEKEFTVGDKKVKAKKVDKVPQGYQKVTEELYYRPGTPGAPGSYVVVPRSGTGRGSGDWRPMVKSLAEKGMTYEDLTRLVPGKGRIVNDLPEVRKIWEASYKPIPGRQGTPDDYVYLTSQTTIPPGTTTNTTLPPGTTKTTTNPPDGKKEEPRKVNPNFNYSGGTGLRKLPFLEDIMNVGLGLVNAFDNNDVRPEVFRPTPVYIDPSFTSDRAEIAAIQSNARTAAEAAVLSGLGPQQLASVLTGVQGNTAPMIAQTRKNQQDRDVTTDMGVRGMNAQTANQFSMNDAMLSKQFSNESDMGKYNRGMRRKLDRTAVTGAFRDLYTHMGEAYLGNQRFPQMAFNPLTYEVAFKPGSGRTEDELDAMTLSGGNNTFNALYKQFYDSMPDVKDDKIRAAQATKMANDYLTQRMTARYNTMNPMAGMNMTRQQTVNRSLDPDDYPNSPYGMAFGGYIPNW